MYALLFLNEVSILHKGKGWQVSSLFETNPTVEQILDHSCLKSNDPNDVAMAKMLVDKGIGRFIYKGKLPFEDFFEVMIREVPVGEPLELWELFLTGYCGSDSSYQILYDESLRDKAV